MALEDKVRSFFERQYFDSPSAEELRTEVAAINSSLIDLCINDAGELRDPNLILESSEKEMFFDLYRKLFYSYNLLTNEEKRPLLDKRSILPYYILASVPYGLETVNYRRLLMHLIDDYRKDFLDGIHLRRASLQELSRTERFFSITKIEPLAKFYYALASLGNLTRISTLPGYEEPHSYYLADDFSLAFQQLASLYQDQDVKMGRGLLRSLKRASERKANLKDDEINIFRKAFRVLPELRGYFKEEHLEEEFRLKEIGEISEIRKLLNEKEVEFKDCLTIIENRKQTKSVSFSKPPPSRAEEINHVSKNRHSLRMRPSAFTNALKLLKTESTGEEEQLAIDLIPYNLDVPHLQRSWKCYSAFDYSINPITRLDNLTADLLRVNSDSTTAELLLSIGKRMKRRVIDGKLYSLDELADSLSERKEYDLGLRKLSFNFQESTTKGLKGFSALMFFFLQSHTCYEKEREKQSDVLLELGDLLKRREEVTFLLQYAPELAGLRRELSDKVGDENLAHVPASIFQAAQLKLGEEIKSQLKLKGERWLTNGTVKGRRQRLYGKYIGATRHLVELEPEGIDIGSIEAFIAPWHPFAVKGDISHLYDYGRLQFEIAKRKKSQGMGWEENLSKVMVTAYKASVRRKELRPDERRSYLPLFSLLIDAADFAEENGFSISGENSLITDTSITDFLSHQNLANELVAWLGDYDGLDERSISKKGKTVFIPRDEQGIAAYNCIVKVGGEELKLEYFLHQVIYSTLKSALEGDLENILSQDSPLPDDLKNDPVEAYRKLMEKIDRDELKDRLTEKRSRMAVPFPKPLLLKEIETSTGKEYLYLMKRGSGLNLTQWFGHQHFEYKLLQEWSLREKMGEVSERGYNELNKALGTLAFFQGVMSRKIMGDTITGEIEIVTNEGTMVEKMEYTIPSFDFLENIIERGFVKSSDPESSERVKEVVGMVREGKRQEFHSLNKTEYFRSRIPYSDSMYDFLVKYEQLVRSYFRREDNGIILHGDAHLNNFLAGGDMLDTKPLQKGNPLLDVTHLLLHPTLSFMWRREYPSGASYKRETFWEELQAYLGNRVGYSRAEEFYALHNSICLLGAMLSQRDARGALYYREEAYRHFDLLRGNEWLEHGEDLRKDLSVLFENIAESPGMKQRLLELEERREGIFWQVCPGNVKF